MKRFVGGTLLAIFFIVGAAVVKGQDAGRATDSVSLKLPTEDQKSPVASFEVVLSPSAPKPGDEVSLTIHATVKDGWHVYPLKLPAGVVGVASEIEIESSRLEPIGDGFACSSSDEKQHSGSWSWSRKYTVSERGLRRIKGFVKFQACNDGTCLAPKKLEFVIRGVRAKKPVVTHVTPVHETVGEPIEISLVECDAVRPKAKLSVSSVLLGSRTEKLAFKGTFADNEKDLTIYLKKSRQYTLANTGTGDTRFENDASYFSIDHNGDGEITEGESFPGNRPFRVGDAMFQVTGVEHESRKLTIQKVAAPLSGTIVGEKCPPFEFTSITGEKITNQSILGKVTLLDVWAVT